MGYERYKSSRRWYFNLWGGAVINLCASKYATGIYKFEFYKDIYQHISIDDSDSNIGEFHFIPEKYTYITGLMKEFSLEFMLSDDSYKSDGEMILQDYNSNDLLKFIFLKNKFDVYFGNTKLNDTSLDNDHLFYIIYKNNKLHGYYNYTFNNFEKTKMTEIFSIYTKLCPYQIEFNHNVDKNGSHKYWSMWLLRISHKADDLYYAK